jgi:outer membrane protein assembly factor BamD
MRRLPLPTLLVALVALVLVPTRLAADLVWTPSGGWKVEGGVLATLGGEQGRNALDLMNKARNAEEGRNISTALKTYALVTKKYPNSVFASEALYRTGLIYQKRQQYYKAFETFQQMLARYPSTDKFTQVVGEEYRIASDLFAGKRSRIWGWLPGFRNKEKAPPAATSRSVRPRPPSTRSTA